MSYRDTRIWQDALGRPSPRNAADVYLMVKGFKTSAAVIDEPGTARVGVGVATPAVAAAAPAV